MAEPKNYIPMAVTRTVAPSGQDASPSPVDDIRTRVPRQHKSESMWTGFKSSLANFCGLVDDDPETADKWQMRMSDLSHDKLIGKGADGEPRPEQLGLREDEADGAARRRCSPRMPISLYKPSRRCQRQVLRKGKQGGIIQTAWAGCSDLMTKEKKSKRKPQPKSRSFTPAALREFCQAHPDTAQTDEVDIGEMKTSRVYDGGWLPPQSGILNDKFFSDPIGTSPMYQGYTRRGAAAEAAAIDQEGPRPASFATYPDIDEPDSGGAYANWRDFGNWVVRERPGIGRRIELPEAFDMDAGFEQPRLPPQEEPEPFMQRMEPEVPAMDNANRRKVNQGWWARLWDQGLLAQCFNIRLNKLYSGGGTVAGMSDEHRPWFTIWLTFVQILLYIVSVSVYGIAPFGIHERTIKKEIIQPNLALKLESYKEKENFWVGPRQADLIRLGAKFSPCMRMDVNVYKAIGFDRDRESNTACCVYNDGSGCVQSIKKECSATLAIWHKWSPANPGMRDIKRLSGSVCGQDPNWCSKPPSLSPFVWPDNISKWPVCTQAVNATKSPENRHMNCPVVGRPCCTGIQGQCIITTREHCTFYRGHFHEEAFLCSQVNCMSDICGMLPFGNPEAPDQFYRLWTCLFLHAGLIHLAITVIFNLLILLPIERTIGWLRVTVIFLGTGLCGSLSSAIFLPYHVEAGPSGSQFGIFATQLVLVILFMNKPWQAAWKILLMILFLLIIGLLPMIDNYAHIFGFIFGFLISFGMLPFARVKHHSMSMKTQRIIAIVVCSILAVGLAAVLIVLFYVAPIYDCPGCKFFNCIQFTPTFCDTMEVSIRKPSA